MGYDGIYHHSCPKGHTNSQESLVLKTFFLTNQKTKSLKKTCIFGSAQVRNDIFINLCFGDSKVITGERNV
jgi:hypothetical protein